MNEDRTRELESLKQMIRKAHGASAVIQLSDIPIFDEDRIIHSGSIGLDIALGVGGYAKGRIIEIYGPEMCLDKDTFVKYSVYDKDTGDRINHKGGSIQRLYERFHSVDETGVNQGRHLRNNNVDFCVPSINEEECVFGNKVADVVKCGPKECFTVTTSENQQITCTKDHKFYVGKGEYLSLEHLGEGQYIYVHNNSPNKKDIKERVRYGEVYVKYHPSNRKKVVTANNRQGEKVYSYDRYRVKRCILAYEASKNGMSYLEYLDRLNTESPDVIHEFWTVPEDFDIHHIDHNPQNDSLENLALLEKSEHHRLHANYHHNSLRFKAQPVLIKSIVPAGTRETYDIKCYAPHNNFVADGIVVHNSGKTTLTLHAMAQCQAAGGICAFIDAEHALDVVYAQNLGVNVEDVLISQPSYGEQALNITEMMARSGDIDLIVIDSVAALTPKSEIEGEMGDSSVGTHARLMSKAMRKLVSVTNQSGTCIMFTNQIRMKIGVMFGSPEVTTGGNALKFYASQRVDIRRRKKIEEGTGDNKEILGNATEVKVVKNKMAPPFKVAKFDIIYGRGIDSVSEVLDFAVDDGLIKKAGAWFSLEDGETRIGQGRSQAVEYLRENPELTEELRSKILEARGLE